MGPALHFGDPPVAAAPVALADALHPPGAACLSVLGRCFTKQTGDMVYTMAENSWLSQLWLDA